MECNSTRDTNLKIKEAIMVEVLDVLKDVLDKKESEHFKNFLSKFPNIKSWYLVSDYCVEDPNKANDVFTFSLLLNIDKLDNIKEYIKLYAPTDLKKTKTVTEGILDFINSDAIYHFSLLIPRNQKLLASLCNKIKFAEILSYMTLLITNTRNALPERAANYDGMLKRIQLVKIDTLKSTFNEKLLRKIFIASCFGAVIIYMLKKHSHPTHIAWISDRDAIINTYDGFAFDNMYFWYEFLATQEKFLPSELQILYIEPEKIGENFADELIRIPDFIAGTLASIDLSTEVNKLQLQEKHKILLQHSFTDSFNHATIRLQKKDDYLSSYNFKWVERK